MKNLASGDNNFGDIHEGLCLLHWVLTLKIEIDRILHNVND